MARRWPWFAWAAVGFVVEVYAITSDRIDPLTRIVGSVRSHWAGRLLYAAVDGMWDQHVREA